MFGIDWNIHDDFDKLLKAEARGSYNSLTHAAASLRRDVIASIERSPYPSKAGRPIHTRKGLMKKAIMYQVDSSINEAVIGPRFSIVETVGEPHEKGRPYYGRNYPKRSFMLPGLLRAVPRMAQHWSGSIG